MIHVTAETLKPALKTFIRHGIVPFIHGKPGIGKSAIAQEIAIHIRFDHPEPSRDSIYEVLLNTLPPCMERSSVAMASVSAGLNSVGISTPIVPIRVASYRSFKVTILCIRLCSV